MSDIPPVIYQVEMDDTRIILDNLPAAKLYVEKRVSFITWLDGTDEFIGQLYNGDTVARIHKRKLGVEY